MITILKFKNSKIKKAKKKFIINNKKQLKNVNLNKKNIKKLIIYDLQSVNNRSLISININL